MLHVSSTKTLNMVPKTKINLDILLIKKQFLSCTSIKKINFYGKINLEQQNEILNNTVNDNLVKKYPIKPIYQKIFLRKFIEKLEYDNCEIIDKLYELHCDFISINNLSNTHYRHFLLNNYSDKIDRIIIKESKNIISEGTTGLISWQAAEALAEWCLVNKDEIDGKYVLELGAGVGLTGLTVLSTCSPHKYIFTDCHPSVLKLLNENIELNLSTLQNNRLYNVNVNVIDFAWESIDEFTNANWTSPDLILAADVVYDTTNFETLITAVKKLLNRTNSYAIIAITVRNESTTFNFITQLGIYGLKYEECCVPNYSIFCSTDDIPIRILKIYK